MKGIDISKHNGTIDFEKVKKDGIDFVIIRIGWIGNKNNHTVDEKFEEYYNNARHVGLKIGFYVYSYAKSTVATLDGAVWALEKIRNKSCDMAVFLDLEDETISHLDKEYMTECATTFCEHIENMGRFKAGVYASKSWFQNKLDINKLLTYKIWVAEWNGKENHSCNFKVDLWQYSSKGSIDGIPGNVDLDKCLNCQNLPDITENENKGSEYSMKQYVNGSTKETVYQDSSCTKEIGYLNPRGEGRCYGIVDGKALIVYKPTRKNYEKCGFVKWLGGIKN